MGNGQRKIGLFGGSFDPIHIGHLILGQDLLDASRIDEIWYIPAGDTPLRSNAPEATPEQRIAMANLACEGRPGMRVMEVEAKREGKSYSVDTVRALRDAEPEATFYWILGTDRFPGLSAWKEADRLVELTTFLVLKRPGHEFPDGSELPAGTRWESCDRRTLEVSSTEIRERVREGKPFDLFLPPGVKSYIEKHNLYHNTLKPRAESITSAYG